MVSPSEQGNAPPPLRVLVADDEPPVRLLVRVNLEIEGIKVFEASDGEEALRLALTTVPDVAVLDVMMPCLDGFAVAEQLRQHEQTANTALIFLTAKIDKEAARRARQFGGLFVPKPFNPVELPQLVRDLARRPG